MVAGVETFFTAISAWAVFADVLEGMVIASADGTGRAAPGRPLADGEALAWLDAATPTLADAREAGCSASDPHATSPIAKAPANVAKARTDCVTSRA